MSTNYSPTRPEAPDRPARLVAEPQNTPLGALHAEWGARMTVFADWRLPLAYPDGVLAEHRAAREGAALFDVSHMAQIALRGKNPAAALARALPVDPAALEPGQSKYAVMLNHDGGALDDLIVANDGPRGFLLVANAARRQADLDHLRQQLPANCPPEEITSRALVAVQGPKAAAALAPLLPAAAGLRFMRAEWQALDEAQCPGVKPGAKVRVSRTGYTGEDGFEISLPAQSAEPFCRVLVEKNGVQPAGLGARDLLRLEAALCLYGCELNEHTSPLEAGLLWTIPKPRREAGDFIGADALRQQIKNGAPRQLVGLRPEGRIILRADAVLHNKRGENIGQVTSGAFSPVLQGPIALALLRAPAPEPGEKVFAKIRGNAIACAVVPTPFVPHRYAK